MKRLIFALVALAFALPAGAVDLMGAYELAVKNDPQLRAAEFRRQARGEGPTQSRSALLPQVTANVSRTLGRSEDSIDGETSTRDIDSEFYAIELRQSLYDHSNWVGLRQARTEVNQADFDLEAERQSFKLRVAERYFDVLTAVDTLEFARAEETALQRQFEQAEQRFEVGLAAVTDVHEARATWDAARARVITADNALEDAKEALREVTGTRFEVYSQLTDDIPLQPPEPEDVEEWVDRAIAYNPELASRRKEEDLALDDVRLARSNHLPTLSASLDLSRGVDNQAIIPGSAQTFTSERDTWQVGVNLSIPIFEGFRVSSRTRQARFNLDATGEELEQSLRSVVRQTENSYRGILAGVREVEARQQAVVSAESALEATQAGFEVGTRTIVDVLLAEQRLFQELRNFSQARHEFILNNLRLRQAAGILEAEDLERVNALLE